MVLLADDKLLSSWTEASIQISIYLVFQSTQMLAVGVDNGSRTVVNLAVIVCVSENTALYNFWVILYCSTVFVACGALTFLHVFVQILVKQSGLRIPFLKWLCMISGGISDLFDSISMLMSKISMC